MSAAWTTWSLQYEDHNGVSRVKEFKTEAARVAFIDKGLDSGKVSQVLAFADPS